MESKETKKKEDYLLASLLAAKPKQIDINIEDPRAFTKLVSFAMSGQDTNIKFNVNYKGKVVTYLTKKENEKEEEEKKGKGKYKKKSKKKFKDQTVNYPYAFSPDGKALSYNNFGDELKQYKPEIVQKIARIILRMMRSASRDSATPEDVKKTAQLIEEVAAIDKSDTANYSPIEILAQLVGSAACETGRAPTGYLNNYASLHRIKHTKSPELMNSLLGELFPNDYDNEKLDVKRHATAFEGSQHAMRVASGLEKAKTYKAYTEAMKQEVEQWQTNEGNLNRRYKTMNDRDLNYVSTFKSKDPSKNKTLDKTFERKIVRHYKQAANAAKNEFYTSSDIKPDGKPLPKTDPPKFKKQVANEEENLKQRTLKGGEYIGDDIAILAQTVTEKYKNIKYMGDSLISAKTMNNLEENLRGYLEANKADISDNDIMVMAINNTHHWSMLAIQINLKDKTVTAKYIDPLTATLYNLEDNSEVPILGTHSSKEIAKQNEELSKKGLHISNGSFSIPKEVNESLEHICEEQGFKLSLDRIFVNQQNDSKSCGTIFGKNLEKIGEKAKSLEAFKPDDFDDYTKKELVAEIRMSDYKAIHQYYLEHNKPEYYAKKIADSEDINDLTSALRELTTRSEEFPNAETKTSFLAEVAKDSKISGLPKVLRSCKSLSELIKRLNELPNNCILPNLQGEAVNVGAISFNLSKALEDKELNLNFTRAFGLRELIVRLFTTNKEMEIDKSNIPNDPKPMDNSDPHNEDKHNKKRKPNEENADKSDVKKEKKDGLKADKDSVHMEDLSEKLEKEIWETYKRMSFTIKPFASLTYLNYPTYNQVMAFDKKIKEYNELNTGIESDNVLKAKKWVEEMKAAYKEKNFGLPPKTQTPPSESKKPGGPSPH